MDFLDSTKDIKYTRSVVNLPCIDDCVMPPAICFYKEICNVLSWGNLIVRNAQLSDWCFNVLSYNCVLLLLCVCMCVCVCGDCCLCFCVGYNAFFSCYSALSCLAASRMRIKFIIKDGAWGTEVPIKVQGQGPDRESGDFVSQKLTKNWKWKSPLLVTLIV